jgi:hypothetical protein
MSASPFAKSSACLSISSVRLTWRNASAAAEAFWGGGFMNAVTDEGFGFALVQPIFARIAAAGLPDLVISAHVADEIVGFFAVENLLAGFFAGGDHLVQRQAFSAGEHVANGLCFAHDFHSRLRFRVQEARFKV